MVKVPVLLGFDHTKPIGTLEIDETQMPFGGEWDFALGYTVQSYEIVEGKRRVRQMKLETISPVPDAEFAYADGRGAGAGTAPAARPAPSREEVWLRAWCAVSGAFNCTTAEAATRWADRALEAFDARFPPK